MEKNKSSLMGHLLGFFSVLVWGSSFIFSKILLEVFTPLQIMTMRFIIAYIVLWCLYPKKEKTTPKDELGIMTLSVFASTIYFICENNALLYTLASNVSIIVAAAPIITALLACLFSKSNTVTRNTWIGFAIAFAGVALVVFNGTVVLKFNPLGDMLSLGAAISWAIYSVMVSHYVDRFSSFFLMRKLTFYGLITTLPILLISGEGHIPFQLLSDPARLFSLIFLGVMGSGVCYVTWNMATQKLGIIAVSNYIYVNPFITMVTAGIFLGEPITVMGLGGMVLIIAGIIISFKKVKE